MESAMTATHTREVIFSHVARLLDARADSKSLARFEAIFWLTTLGTLHLEDHFRTDLGMWVNVSLWSFLVCSLLTILLIGIRGTDFHSPSRFRSAYWDFALPIGRFGAAASFTVYASLKTYALGLRNDEAALALGLWLIAMMGPWARRSTQFLIAAIFISAGLQKLIPLAAWWWNGEAIQAWLRWSNLLYVGQYADWQRELNRWLLVHDLKVWLGPAVVMGEISLGIAALSRRTWPLAALGMAAMLIGFRSVLYVPFSLLAPLLIFAWSWPQRGSSRNDEDEMTVIQGTA
jgi:hypothetical protein